MKITVVKILAVSALIGLISNVSVAQNPNGAALKQISDIVASINHFPSDADKATLATIAGNDALAQGVRNMATAVSNISHAANAEGKEQMSTLAGNDQVPEGARALAGVIAGLNHVASDEAKATLAQHFP